jgi:hypothetical protein
MQRTSTPHPIIDEGLVSNVSSDMGCLCAILDNYFPAFGFINILSARASRPRSCCICNVLLVGCPKDNLPGPDQTNKQDDGHSFSRPRPARSDSPCGYHDEAWIDVSDNHFVPSCCQRTSNNYAGSLLCDRIRHVGRERVLEGNASLFPKVLEESFPISPSLERAAFTGFSDKILTVNYA